MPSSLRSVAVLLSVTAASILTWFAWLSWDTGYRTLPDGSVEGPYTPMQVVACATTLALVVVAGCLAVRCAPALGTAVVACATGGFSFAWARDAAASDDTGLWIVGLLLLVGGCVLGLGVVALLTWQVRARLLRRS